MNFKNLHQKENPLLISNVWDVASAKEAEDLDFEAIGTSSGAIATMLGYEDGEEISFRELKYIIERIVKSVDIPVSVDLEAGYGSNSREIVRNILEMSDLGVVGVNIEDSKVANGQRSMIKGIDFSGLLKSITSELKLTGREIFVNVRTDTYLMNIDNALQETLVRAKQYEKAGADGLFVPCIEKQGDIEKVIKGTDLPLNVMCMPNLPSFYILKDLGVSRISMGNFVFNRMKVELRNFLDEIKFNQNFTSLF
ncbi:isocitrate lyase/phosphoenolpyruvate mutase family protein [Cytophaga sp. FL35]|uniref:isocitrate lyase/PEP mutase family protein n=1 Tax=Cytophaga sp. FL35 TaxID=1904456 RepID=UPI0016536406|nr:isocitrate lyase/phosphoenolpyruvate mutase family protein [Cytophaga sp. FL35]MBC7000793.1 isocitrate lyase/phosphoenolpyruvate mutase family protein [Cytophaga sp. FL35]